MTRSKTIREHVDVGSDRIGVTVGEFQLLKNEYDLILRPMVRDCDVRIVCIGSCDKYGILGHPFTFEQRKTMIEAVHGPVFKFVQLHDIDAVEPESWVRYVLSQIAAAGLPAPTDFYVGSESDAGWYRPAFPDQPSWLTPDEERLVSENTQTQEFQKPRRLHVMGRTQDMVSARDLRTYVEQRNPNWRKYVPARLWTYVERHYPPKIRTAVQAETIPSDGAYPHWTRLRLRETQELLELKPDGQWRPLPQRDEKGDYARRQHKTTSEENPK